MTYVSGSYFLSCNGMFMIFMNFMPAILIYSLVAQQTYFGIFQVMSIFLIISIGADDIFVLLDTWGQANIEVYSFGVDRPGRLQVLNSENFYCRSSISKTRIVKKSTFLSEKYVWIKVRGYPKGFWNFFNLTKSFLYAKRILQFKSPPIQGIARTFLLFGSCMKNRKNLGLRHNFDMTLA